MLELVEMPNLRSKLADNKGIKLYALLALAVVSYILILVTTSLYSDGLILDYTTTTSPPIGVGSHISITKTLGRYDAVHYVHIAKYGYTSKNDAAFMPLYPLSIRLVERLTSIPYIWSGIFISWLSLAGLAALIYKWAELELKTRKIELSPWWVLGVLAIVPSAFFLIVPYTESLFLLFTVGALLTYRNKSYFIAACLAGLSAATRDQGIVIVVYFILDYLLAKKWSDVAKLLPVIGGILGLAAYMIFLQIHYGSALAFITAEKQWDRFSGNFIKTVFDSFRPIYVWFIAFVALGLWSVWKYLDKPYFFYSLALIVLPLLSGSFISFNRFELIVVPFALSLAIYLKKHANIIVQLIFMSSSVFLLAFSIILFANGYFIG